MPRAPHKCVTACLVALFASSAFGQDLAPLTDLAACRIDAERVALSFSYTGGACQETGDAKAELIEGALVTVSVPTINTAEVCTMQAVEIEFAGAVAVPEAATALSVQVLNPDGEVQAGSKTDIAAASPECKEPATE